MNNLKACPFCGNTDHKSSVSSYMTDASNNGKIIHFLCIKCKAEGPGSPDDFEIAQYNWNKRTDGDSNHCPFCGSSSINIQENKKDKGEAFIYSIFCTDCKAFGPLGFTEEEAKDRWKKRVPSTES